MADWLRRPLGYSVKYRDATASSLWGVGMKVAATILVACAALSIQANVSGAYATKITGQCTGTTVTEFVTSDSTDSTSSTDWVNLTDGTLNFKTAAAGCLIINFSGPVYDYAAPGEDYNQLHLRAVLDTNTLCVPPNYNDAVSQDREPTSTKAISMIRVCPNVGRGYHKVRVQYRSDNTEAVVILSHVLTVAHR